MVFYGAQRVLVVADVAVTVAVTSRGYPAARPDRGGPRQSIAPTAQDENRIE
jgi:hypothetical protein